MAKQPSSGPKRTSLKKPKADGQPFADDFARLFLTHPNLLADGEPRNESGRSGFRPVSNSRPVGLPRFETNSLPMAPGENGEGTFIEHRTKLHLEMVKEQATILRERERTKRVGLYLAAALLALACLIPVFAPSGRETVSYLISAALLVFAAGAIGFTRLRLDRKGDRLEVSSDR